MRHDKNRPPKAPPRKFSKPSPRRGDRGASEGPKPDIRRMDELLRQCGIRLSPDELKRLWMYHELLRQRNDELNLVRVRNFANMVLKLYADSLLPGELIALPSPLLDLGTGAGMPGIPLKIAHPETEILLAESRRQRAEFLREAVDRLELQGVRVIDRSVSPAFQEPVQGVVTRALGPVAATLERVGGCLARGGQAIFMKGPRCDEEIRQAQRRFSGSYRLVEDLHYRIGETPHQRRLVIFQRLEEPGPVLQARAMERHVVKDIESERNPVYKDLKKLLTPQGIRKSGRALVFGQKPVLEMVRDFPGQCRAWIGREQDPPPPRETPPAAHWYRLASGLFNALDIFGTGPPLLLVEPPPLEAWDPREELPPGCTLLIPFQDPENVGAVVRSAAALGAAQVVLLGESAHPWHPKAVRASAGAVFRLKLRQGPPLKDLPPLENVYALSSEGEDIRRVAFPPSFGLLAGLEGPGLPDSRRERTVSVPMKGGVESLNAAVAAAVALYEWSRGKFGRTSVSR